MKRIFTFLVLLFFACSLQAQFTTLNQGKIKQKKYLQEISYQEIVGYIIIPVTINGKVYKFLFDTGATLAISDKIYKELNLKVIRQINAVDASGEGKPISFILLPEIDIQGITFRNTPGAVFHENSDASKLAECLGIDGIIGSNMLRNSLVQFDAQKKQIIIANDIKNILPPNSKYQKIKLSFWQKAPFINITMQKGVQKVENSVLFDTGDNGRLFTLSLNELNDSVVEVLAESEGSFSIGAHGFYNKQRHLLLRIPELVVNRLIFTDVIATTTQDKKSRLGVKFLQYGKTTLDYKKKRFYFEPFDNIKTDELSEMPRAVDFNVQNNKLVVGIIWDKQLESKINLGDVVLSINGVDLQSMGFCELFMLDIPYREEQILELRDINTGEIKNVEILRFLAN